MNNHQIKFLINEFPLSTSQYPPNIIPLNLILSTQLSIFTVTGLLIIKLYLN